MVVVEIKELEARNGKVLVAVDCESCMGQIFAIAEMCPSFTDFVLDDWGGKIFASEIDRIVPDFVETLENNLADAIKAELDDFVLRIIAEEYEIAKACLDAMK